MFLQRIEVADFREALGLRVFHRVAIVNSIDLGGLENDLGGDLVGTQGGGRVGGAVRVTGTTAEDDHASFLEMTHRPPADERLGHLRHGNGGLDAGRHPLFFQRILQCHGVYHCGEHSHLVAGHPLDALLAALQSAKNIPSPNDDADLHAELCHLAHLRRDVVDGLGTDAAGFPAEHFPADLQQDTAELRFFAVGGGGRFLFCRHGVVGFTAAKQAHVNWACCVSARPMRRQFYAAKL